MAITIGITGDSITEAQAQLRELLSQLEPNDLRDRLSSKWQRLSCDERNIFKTTLEGLRPEAEEMLPDVVEALVGFLA